MGEASKPSSVAIGPRTPTTWPHKSRRSRKKHRLADPTPLEAIRRDLPKEDEVRAYIAEFVDANRANQRLGIGLLAAKLMDSRRPPRDLSGKVREVFGIEVAGSELRSAALEARTAVQDGLKRRFDCAPPWHLRWLPEIAK